ncbi:MAG TPA: hypothetical protein VGV87_30730, partial [Blastocatellia bacterium]|nr:hypothetical protein [Blastocatellia bacterium]
MERLAETSGRVRGGHLLTIQVLLLLLMAFCAYRGYFEAGPTTIVGGVLLIVWQMRPNWFEGATRWVGRLAKRPLIPIALVVGLSFGVAGGVSCSRGFPQPWVNDEFSYLLAADTFLQGRVTNPAHPMWIHLETMQVIFQPTYASKYPPAQGLALAAGRLVGGRAIVGVWLSTALACGLICWCSMAWLGRSWGFLGGLLAAVHPLVLEWSQNYWGGAVAMAGGALVFGAFRKLARKPNALHSWLLGIGMAIMSFSRPYEGAVVCVLVLVALLFLTLRDKRVSSARLFRSVGIPVILSGVLIMIGWGCYNLRVTGNPLQMPVVVHEQTYAMARPFFWQTPYPEPAYRHKVMRDCEMGLTLPLFLRQRNSVAEFYSAAIDKLSLYSGAAFQGCGAIVLIALYFARRDRFLRLALAILVLFGAALLAEIWSQPHYAAPAAAVVV